jgi:AmmeMemoRadiSam system protein A
VVNEPTLTNEHHRALLTVAADSIAHGLRSRMPLAVEPARFDQPLRLLRATFVTLKLAGRLRGCIGTLEAVRPLVADVAYNAFAAALSDPRFAPLGIAEQTQVNIHISVLSPPQPMTFAGEDDLLSQIRPNIDGLILEDAGRRGTFLPSVWESLPDVATFWSHLKTKAGLPANHWSDTLRVSRYTTESIE